MRSPRLKRKLFCAVVLLWLFCPDFLFAQTKKLREMKVSYPFGGSTSFFWVANARDLLRNTAWGWSRFTFEAAGPEYRL